jgi:hypothetical protein
MTLNARNQSKWDSLQDAGHAHIDRILAGKGSKEDLDAISKLLAEQHELAGQIFDQGVEDAVKTANQVVDSLERKRIESGKKALTDRAQERLFNRAFQDVMSQAIEDILGQVHDEFEQQEQTIRTRVESALERIRAMPVPQQVPAGERNPLDRLLDRSEPEQGAPETPQNRALMDRVLDRQERADQQRTEVMQMIRDTAGAIRDRVSSLYERFSRSNEENDEERRANIWLRKLKAVFSPFGRAWSKAKSGASKASDLFDMISRPLLMAVMNPQLIQSITDEVSRLLNFDNISKFVDSTWEETKKLGTDSLDWIIDKVKSLLGFGTKEKKKSETRAEVKPVAKTTELPKEISAEEAKKALPTQQSGLAQAQQRLSEATARYTANPTAANKKAVDEAQLSVNYWQSRVTMYGSRAQQVKTAGSDIEQAKTLVTPAQAPQASASTAVGEISSSQAATAVQQATEVSTVPAPTTVANPQEMLNKSSAATPVSTQVIGDMPRFLPGRSYDSPEKQAEEKTAEEKSKAAIAQIGMGSFGFDSGDSALNILNLGMIS